MLSRNILEEEEIKKLKKVKEIFRLEDCTQA